MIINVAEIYASITICKCCSYIYMTPMEVNAYANFGMCHRGEPVWPGVSAPPQGILLDTPESIRRHARLIDINAVRSRAMKLIKRPTPFAIPAISLSLSLFSASFIHNHFVVLYKEFSFLFKDKNTR